MVARYKLATLDLVGDAKLAWKMLAKGKLRFLPRGRRRTRPRGPSAMFRQGSGRGLSRWRSPTIPVARCTAWPRNTTRASARRARPWTWPGRAARLELLRGLVGAFPGRRAGRAAFGPQHADRPSARDASCSIPCAACFQRLKHADKALRRKPRAVDDGDLPGEPVPIFHVNDFFHRPELLEVVKQKVKRPLAGLAGVPTTAASRSGRPK